MRESSNLEYKEIINHSFLKTVSAYANYAGGTIKFGIKDDGNIIGVSNPVQSCLDIENRINDSIKPRVDFKLEIDKSTDVIVLSVFEGRNKPYFYKSKAYKRNDSSTVEMDQLELKRLILSGDNIMFESLKTNFEDLNFIYLERMLKNEMGITQLNKDILISLELYDPKGGYNLAAELLADKNDFIGTDVAKFGDNINIILSRDTFDKISILEQFDKTMSLFRRSYQYEEIKGTKRIEVETIPEEAFREALANAIVHRQWDVKSHIRVAMYSKYVEIISPGGLPEGLSEEEYLKGQISILRNPIIGNIFFRLHHIEKFGTGVKRILNSYEKSLVKPKFFIYDNSIRITLPVMEYNFENSLSEDEAIIYKIFNDNIEYSSTDITNLTKFGKTKVVEILNSLVEHGYIRIKGRGRGTKYIK
jgi:ATP-dependent DNA helicase RecG